MPTPTISPNLAAQHAYIEALKERGFKFGLTVGDAFVRGIRDLGYKNTGNALAELVDNSIQAGASRIDILFGYGKGSSDKKPSEIAIVDNGHGMEAAMIRFAVMWGGTHREGDREGMGRYGYGLPCSSVSIGKRFTVYSKIDGGGIHAVTIDLDAISTGDYTDETGEIIVPEPKAAKLPKFVADAVAAAYPEGWHGTAVVIEKLDRIQWKTAGALRENLLRNFGVTYHKLRSEASLYVDGDYVEPIDPLFLTPGFRFFELDGDNDRAVALEPIRIGVKDTKTRETIGDIVVRLAYFPPTFGSIDKRRDAVNKNANARFAVMKDYHGILFSRMDRLIDVEMRPPWGVFQNNDRYIKVEVEFPAALDEEFGITTAKQQVTVSERIWDILQQHGVPKAIEQMRGKVSDLKKKRREAAENPPQGGERPSEEAMADAMDLMRGPSSETKAKQESEGEKRLRQNAETRAEGSGRTPAEEEEQLLLELGGRKFKVEKENLPGGQFFRCEMLSATKVLYINRDHRFYQDLYDGPQSSPEVRAALEVVLLAIGDSILDASQETARMYKVELPLWSQKVDLALERLAENVGLGGDREEAEPDGDGQDKERAEAA
jgi:hypothetical protein